MVSLPASIGFVARLAVAASSAKTKCWRGTAIEQKTIMKTTIRLRKGLLAAT